MTKKEVLACQSIAILSPVLATILSPSGTKKRHSREYSPIDNVKPLLSGKAELSHSFPRVQLNRVSGSPVCSLRLREAIP